MAGCSGVGASDKSGAVHNADSRLAGNASCNRFLPAMIGSILSDFSVAPERDGMTPGQARAARAFLNLDMKTVCEQAPIGKRTLTEFERGSRAIADTTLARLRGYYIAQGIGFKSTDSGDEITCRDKPNEANYDDSGNVKLKLEYDDRFGFNEIATEFNKIEVYIDGYDSYINFSRDIINAALSVAGLNQKQFASELNCSPAFVSAVLLQKKLLSVDLARKIQDKYRINGIHSMVVSEKKIKKLLADMRRISSNLVEEVKQMQQVNSIAKGINL